MGKDCQRSKLQAVEMSSLRGECGVNRMDGENNECVYRRFGVSGVWGRRNEQWSGGDGEVQHTEMVWTFGKDG